MGKLIDKLSNSIFFRVAALRILTLFLFHATVFLASYVMAWLLRFEFHIPPDYISSFKTGLPYVVGTQLIVGAFFGFYRGWWRYVGMVDVIRLVFGLSVSLALLIGVWYIGDFLGYADRVTGISRGALLIDWAFALLTLFGARVMIRIGRDHSRVNQPDRTAGKRVLIIGAGDAGETLAREIEHRPQLGMKVVAFVDDHRAKWSSQIRGIRVCGPISTVRKIADETGATEALIAIPSASGKRLREIIHHLGDSGVPFKTMPGIDQLVSGKVHVTQLRPVNVEDLLRRDEIDLPGDPVRQLFKGKRVLVTGAGGTIGSELALQVLDCEPGRLHLVDRSEYALYECTRLVEKQRGRLKSVVSHLLDIRDETTLKQVLEDFRPEIVLHAAAHKHVPLGEQNAPEYIRNNTLATRRLAELCDQTGIERFVFISTDKAINPSSVMGASKRAAEILLLDLRKTARMKMTIVRFGNVIGSSGSVIPLFIEQIAAGGPITVTDPEVTRYFIRTSEAISLVLQAATLGNGGDVFMLDMGEPIRIADLAKDLIRLSNHAEEEIEIVYTGLRPGEKLFEEIRLDSEANRPTQHPQIVVSEAAQPDPLVVRGWISRVHPDRIAFNEAVPLLKALVPEFDPEESAGTSQSTNEPSSPVQGLVTEPAL